MNRVNGRNSLGRLAALAAYLLMQGSAGAVGAAATTTTASGAAPSVAAQWHPYELQFHYFGFTTYYSCSGLEDRLKGILLEMGADRDVKVSATGCFGHQDIGKSLQARIRVRMPVLEGAVADEPFQAISKAVNLTTNSSGGMGSGDCELLEQVRDQLLPALKLPLISDDLRCVPGQPTIGVRTLQVRALVVQADTK